MQLYKFYIATIFLSGFSLYSMEPATEDSVKQELAIDKKACAEILKQFPREKLTSKQISLLEHIERALAEDKLFTFCPHGYNPTCPVNFLLAFQELFEGPRFQREFQYDQVRDPHFDYSEFKKALAQSIKFTDDTSLCSIQCLKAWWLRRAHWLGDALAGSSGALLVFIQVIFNYAKGNEKVVICPHHHNKYIVDWFNDPVAVCNCGTEGLAEIVSRYIKVDPQACIKKFCGCPGNSYIVNSETKL